MSVSPGALTRILKRSSTVRWLNNTTLAEIVSESLNRRLPLNYRIMRFVSRSNYLRDAAIRRYSRCSRLAIKTTPETIFGGLNVKSAVRELNEKGFAVGVALSPQYVADILKF